MTEFSEVYRKAFQHYDQSRFVDAATLFLQASILPGITEREHLLSRRWLGASYYITGRYSEAVSQFDEILKVCQHDERYYVLACDTFQFQIHTFVAIADIIRTKEKYEQVLLEIDKVLTWMKDVQHDRDRHCILLDKARVLGKMGSIEKAFDVAEEAYDEKKSYHGGYYSGYYIKVVAKYARLQGYPDRARQVLKEFCEERADPHTRVQVLIEWLRLFLDMTPPNISESVATARKMHYLMNNIQSPLNKLVANGEMGLAYIRAGLLSDAQAVFQVVRDSAVLDEQNHQRLLLIRAQEYMTCAGNLLTQDTTPVAVNLKTHLSEFSKEIELQMHEMVDAKKTLRKHQEKVAMNLQ
jgi:tetratricopeptide (TPR) repeat protein